MKHSLGLSVAITILSLALSQAASAQPRLGPPPGAGAVPAPNPTPPPGPPAAGQQGDLGPVVGDGKFVVQPPTIRVGQKATVKFVDFPEFSTQDKLVVVPAGVPDSMGTGFGAEDKPLAGVSASAYYISNGWQVGPFAPGVYELRWLTTLYNNENRLEVGARGRLTVTR